MSADFEKVLVKDSRLDVSDSIKYAVIKGGQNVTCSKYGAISNSNNQLVFNIQVPSEQTIIDRRVLLRTELNISVRTTSPSSGTVKSGCYYGTWAALAAFPLHQLMTVMSATINNNTVSINIRDALPAIIRLLDTDDLVNYNSSTPTFADTFASYSPTYCGYGISHPNACYWAANEALVPHRGTFLPKSYTVTHADTELVTVEDFVFTLVEPLLLSPFIFSNLKSNGQGFYGIQNMNFVLNIGNTKRVFRGLGPYITIPTQANPSPQPVAANKANIEDVYITPNKTLFTEPELLFTFLTPHPSDLLPARNIVPFYELPRYITPSTTAVLAATYGTGADGLSVTPVGFSVKTNSLQLNQIPDKLIIYVRDQQTVQSWYSPDVAYPITNVVVNFNNNSGILASATQVQLWQMSHCNGLQETWNDFRGYGVVSSQQDKTQLLSEATTDRINGVKGAPTVGSYLVLEFGKDIQLTEDFYACGSLGNFNLQINLTCENNKPYDITSDVGVEVVLITMNSGVFVCERGTSSTYTGILTKQDVLEASQQDHYTHDDVSRLVGGGFFDKVKSGLKGIASKGKELAMEQVKKHGPALMEKGKHYAMKKGKEALDKYLGPQD